MARITYLRIEGLLDHFEHEINFPAEWNYILLYGPNGVGKTKLLELLNFLYKCDFGSIANVPFADLLIRHHDGAALRVNRNVDQGTGEGRLNVSLALPGQDLIAGQFYDATGARTRRELIENTDWRPLSENLWRDQSDGEIAEWDDLMERYGRVTESRRRHQKFDEIPPKLLDYLRETPVHLIATQRLLYETVTPSRNPFQNRRSGVRQATIAAYANDLKNRLAVALLDNTKYTQPLDRSFPRRLLDITTRQQIDADEIRERYRAQNDKREKLAEIGLMNSEVDVPLPDRELDGWELNVLHTYLNDTDQKLGTFDDIATRVFLFREIANNRFLNKTLSINTEDGITITRHSDGKTIPPTSLSSGEQHELVLMYDLLFNVDQGALVLIDEPEISLHVAWQKSFIGDIDRIAALASLRFVIATHSPQIINKSWNQTSELGPVDKSADR